MLTRLKKGDNIPFTQVSNAVLYSSALSFKAKGLYAYMLAKPDGWSFSIKRIVKETKEGITGVTSALDELKEVGLIEYTKLSTGRSEYTIYADLADRNDPKPENPIKASDPKPENPNLEKAIIGKPDPYITHSSINKEIINSQKKSYEEQRAPSQCENSHSTNKAGIDSIMKKLKSHTRLPHE